MRQFCSTQEIPAEEAGPGDLVLYKVAHALAHGAIIIEWPNVIIHALNRAGVVLSHGTQEGFVLKRERRFLTLGFPIAESED